MYAKKKSYEEVNARCKQLEDLGFEINHNDSNVDYKDIRFSETSATVDISFDFSVVDVIGSEAFLRTVITTTAKQMYQKGVEDQQRKMRKALGIEEEG